MLCLLGTPHPRPSFDVLLLPRRTQLWCIRTMAERGRSPLCYIHHQLKSCKSLVQSGQAATLRFSKSESDSGRSVKSVQKMICGSEMEPTAHSQAPKGQEGWGVPDRVSEDHGKIKHLPFLQSLSLVKIERTYVPISHSLKGALDLCQQPVQRQTRIIFAYCR